jgi:hydroxyacylglutathione hydrolase
MPVHPISGGYANTYVIEDSGVFAAVDVGTSLAAHRVHRYLCQRSIPPSRLRMVTATHFHIDHVGGISRTVQLFPEATVCFFTMVGDYLRGKARICLFSPATWLKGLLPVVAAQANHLKNTGAQLVSDKVGIPLPLFRRLQPSTYRAECVLDEGRSIPALPCWQVLRTPGHTDDSVCFYSSPERTLISGDTILNMGGSGELNRFCCDRTAIRESFEKLAFLGIEHIYPGHGRPLWSIHGLGDIVQ